MPALSSLRLAALALVPVQGYDMADRVANGECVGAGLSFTFADDLYFPGLPTIEVATEEAEIAVASLISMKYGGNFKVLTHQTAKEQYILTQCGTEQPSDADVEALAPLPTGFARKHFDVPLKVAIAESTTALGFVEALGIEDRFTHISEYATGACFQKANGCGDPSLSWDADAKATQMATADAVFMDCSWGGDCDNVRNQANGVLFSATSDAGNLHTAEYIKYMSAFFNLEPEAKEHFAKTVQRYNSAAPDAANKPVVAWLEYNTDSWSDPPQPYFRLQLATYRVQLVEHAGGVNVDGDAFAAVLGEKATATTTTAGTDYKVFVKDFEDAAAASAAIFAALGSVDAIIDETYVATPEDYTMATFLSTMGLEQSSSLAFVQNQMVLRYDGKLSAGDGWDWYESRVAYPDAAVQGLARMLHADATKPVTYFRNIAKAEDARVQRITSDNCEIKLPVCDNAAPKALSAPAQTATTTKNMSKEEEGASDAFQSGMGLAVLLVSTASCAMHV